MLCFTCLGWVSPHLGRFMQKKVQQTPSAAATLYTSTSVWPPHIWGPSTSVSTHSPSQTSLLHCHCDPPSCHHHTPAVPLTSTLPLLALPQSQSPTLPSCALLTPHEAAHTHVLNAAKLQLLLLRQIC